MIYSHINKSVFLFAFLLAACSDHHHEDGEHHHDHEVEARADTSKADHDHANDEDHDDHDDRVVTRSAGTHTHGGSEIGLVLDGKKVIAEFDTPLYNILGFEHAPDTQAQKRQVTKAEETLMLGGDLFSFNRRAGCRFIAPETAIALFPTLSTDDEHAHEDGHDEETHDHDEDETHKDLILHYEFICENPDKLENVSINLFEFFDELSDINVTYLGPSTQKQFSLTRENTKMDLN